MIQLVEPWFRRFCGWDIDYSRICVRVLDFEDFATMDGRLFVGVKPAGVQELQ